MTQLVLVVEDEASLAADLRAYLQRDGFRTEVAADGEQALGLWRAASPDLILLDVMLPKLDGLEVMRRIREHSDVPIILVTARGEEMDRLVGLGLGADDYVVKPYSPREVIARVKAVLRRVAPEPRGREILRAGRLEVNLASFEATCDGQSLTLTRVELQLLATLLEAHGGVRSRRQLLPAEHAWESDERVIDTHVKNLRRKLGPCAELLETVRGVGYRLKLTPVLEASPRDP